MIWDMVAYLQKQPKMTAAEYEKLTANAGEEHEHVMQGAAMPASAGSAPAMPASTGTQ